VEVTATFAESRGHYVGAVGLVPTMGYFHEGHLSLMRVLRKRCDTLVVSLFINPAQFDRPEDMSAYPQDFDRDRSLAESEEVDILFAPKAEEAYPHHPSTMVEVPEVSRSMEGQHRPGHFTGVATVVAKLFAGLQPDQAIFGRKDAQQLAVIRAMTRDLRFPVEIIEAPMVREPDGLALSSRNVRLDIRAREDALAISRGLFQAAEQIQAGEVRADRLEATVSRSTRRLDTQYATLASLNTMSPIEALDQPAVLAVAAVVSGVRLIDNITIDFVDGRPVPDRGLILDHPSRLITLP
jgi:pantoate--beta-alanine ligase